MSEFDISLGSKAVEWGWITPKAMARALQVAWTGTPPRPLWRVLVDEKVLSATRVETLRAECASPQKSTSTPDGPQLGVRYQLEKKLGEGGMGVVHQVWDRRLGRSVAMKLLSKGADVAGETADASLRAEARVAGMLEHPNIIPVYDIGTLPTEQPYYTMRLMDSMSLDDILQMVRSGNPEAAREFTLNRLLRIFQQVCMAVDYAHSRGVIHRDLKPDNVRVGRYGEVQLADWGLAKVEGRPDLPLEKALREIGPLGSDTEPCIVIGSPNYMSPEQACGKNAEISPASDIYSLGCVLYEILTQEPPFDHPDTMVLLDRVEVGEFVPPSEMAPDRLIPPVLEDVCMAALEREPQDRIQDVRVLWRALEDYLSGVQENEVSRARAFQEIQRGARFSDAYERLCTARNQLQVRLDAQESLAEGRQIEQELRVLNLQVALAWGHAYDAYTRATGFWQNDLVGRAKLAELAWSRLRDAEAAGNDVECQFYWQMLEHHNDGAWDEVLAGQATLRVCSEPEGATVSLRSGAVSEYTTDSTDWRAEGRTPLVLPELPAGLLLLTLEHPLFPLVVRSVFLRGGTEREIAVDFRSEFKEEPSDTGSSRG